MEGKKAEKNLSGNIMKLKFMQRGKERELMEKLEAEQRQVVDASHWVADISKLPKQRVTSQFVFMTEHPLYDPSLSGRRSYGSFNPAIEKIMEKKRKQQRTEKKRKKRQRLNDQTDHAMEMDSSISKEEMMQSLGQFVREARNSARASEAIHTTHTTSAPGQSATHTETTPSSFPTPPAAISGLLRQRQQQRERKHNQRHNTLEKGRRKGKNKGKNMNRNTHRGKGQSGETKGGAGGGAVGFKRPHIPPDLKHSH